jgi:hypothetical protein
MAAQQGYDPFCVLPPPPFVREHGTQDGYPGVGMCKYGACCFLVRHNFELRRSPARLLWPTSRGHVRVTAITLLKGKALHRLKSKTAPIGCIALQTESKVCSSICDMLDSACTPPQQDHPCLERCRAWASTIGALSRRAVRAQAHLSREAYVYCHDISRQLFRGVCSLVRHMHPLEAIQASACAVWQIHHES